MYRKYFFITLIATALLAVCAVSSVAQTAGVRGKVMLRQADGTTVPAENATIDIFRLEVAGKMENIKTNKRGEFSALGLQVGQKYVIAVSAPNAKPKTINNFKPGQQTGDLIITLDPGDGRRLTADEAKQMASGEGVPGANDTGESEEARAKREEMMRKNAEIEAGNKKIEEINALYNRVVKEGNELYAAKRYDEAVAKYSEAITADAEHPGAPVILTNRSIVLRMSAVDKYNAAVKNKDEAGKEAAKKDWKQSAQDAMLAVERLKAAGPPADMAAASNYKDQYYRALLARAAVMKFFVPLVDRTKADVGQTAYQEYLAVEMDATTKLKMQLEGAQMLFDAGEVDKAVVEFQRVLEANPDNVEAMLGAGLALFGTGDSTKYQDAANYLQRFVDKAPDTHAFKADAKAVLEELKNQNVKPQKGTTGGRRRG